MSFHDAPRPPQDGGGLELYPVLKDTEGVPDCVPTTVILPMWNTMAMFTVVPGQSFHSVQEVYSPDKPRLSIQGRTHGPPPLPPPLSPPSSCKTSRSSVDVAGSKHSGGLRDLKGTDMAFDTPPPCLSRGPVDGQSGLLRPRGLTSSMTGLLKEQRRLMERRLESDVREGFWLRGQFAASPWLRAPPP